MKWCYVNIQYQYPKEWLKEKLGNGFINLIESVTEFPDPEDDYLVFFNNLYKRILSIATKYNLSFNFMNGNQGICLENYIHFTKGSSNKRFITDYYGNEI